MLATPAEEWVSPGGGMHVNLVGLPIFTVVESPQPGPEDAESPDDFHHLAPRQRLKILFLILAFACFTATLATVRTLILEEEPFGHSAVVGAVAGGLLLLVGGGSVAYSVRKSDRTVDGPSAQLPIGVPLPAEGDDDPARFRGGRTR